MNQNKETPFLNKTPGILIHYLKTNSVIPRYAQEHYHKSYEIYYLISGEKYYFIKDKTYVIKAGDVVLINSYDLHKTSLVNNHDTERILVGINENFISFIKHSYPNIDLMSCFKHDMPVLRLSSYNTLTIKEHLFKMLNFYGSYKNNTIEINELYLKIMCVELLILLNEFADNNKLESFEHLSIVQRKISDVIVFINKDYMNEHSLESISSKFHISKYYFQKLFKEITGLTFIDYLNITRLKKSQDLLRKTDFAISKIANEIGYSDASYFCKVFKKYHNYSPSQYRKVHMHEE